MPKPFEERLCKGLAPFQRQDAIQRILALNEFVHPIATQTKHRAGQA